MAEVRQIVSKIWEARDVRRYRREEGRGEAGEVVKGVVGEGCGRRWRIRSSSVGVGVLY